MQSQLYIVLSESVTIGSRLKAAWMIYLRVWIQFSLFLVSADFCQGTNCHDLCLESWLRKAVPEQQSNAGGVKTKQFPCLEEARSWDPPKEIAAAGGGEWKTACVSVPWVREKCLCKPRVLSGNGESSRRATSASSSKGRAGSEA